jgi:hypothetical protein
MSFILANNDAYGFMTLLLTISFLIIAYVLLLNNLIALFKYVNNRLERKIYLPSSKNPTGFLSDLYVNSDRIPGCGPTFGSLVLESDRILVSEFDGTYRWVLTGL